MKSIVLWGSCLLFGLASLATAAEKPHIQALVAGNTAFACDLYAQLRAADGNLFFAPHSISTALAMTYAGARGATAAQMATALHFTSDQDALHPAFADLAAHWQSIRAQGDVALTIANALWIQENLPLLKEFVILTDQFYGSQLFPVDFVSAAEATRATINTWIAQQTQGKIRDLIPPGVLSDLTRLVLTNAIYFKGPWAFPFNQDATQDDDFWLTPDKSVTTPMMGQQASFKYGENDLLQVLELPYAGEDLAMVILLPKARDGLAAMEQQFQPERLAAWLTEVAYQDVAVSLPKFTLTAQFSLAAPLKAMGMSDAFAEQADFSGILAEQPLQLAEVLHKAFVEVSEEGTEAAGATGAIVGVTAMMEPQPAPVFKADHPFIFLIRDHATGSLLFIGRLVNPAE